MLFISLEGIEGSGKTSLIQSLEKHFRDLGKDVLVTREPGGCELGLEIRKILLHSEISSLSELLLFAADRAEHVETVIKPALKEGKVVLCDRYIHSTLAYQGYGRGLDLKTIEKLNQLATTGLMPDRVLVLDLEPEQILGRAKNRAEYSDRQKGDPDSWTKFEEEEISFHKRIREGFLALAKENPQLIKVIDASKTQEEVLKQSIQVL